LCAFVYIIAVDSNSQTLQPITLELRRRKISKGSDIPLKRPRLDKNSCESPVCVCVATNWYCLSLPTLCPSCPLLLVSSNDYTWLYELIWVGHDARSRTHCISVGYSGIISTP
jgi:hypothetical protein